jgi:hypothetical protein
VSAAVLIRRRCVLRSTISLLLLLAACNKDSTGDTGDAPTYHADIRPVIEARCLDCHQPGGVGPSDFTYDEAAWADGPAPWAAAAARAVDSGEMPPWLPSDDCHPIEDARGLTDEQRELFRAWSAAGYPAGDPSTYVAPEIPERPMEARKATFGPPDHSLQAPTPYTPNAAQPDDYRCIVTDLEFAEDTWIRGLEVEVDQVPYVHHMIAYVYYPEDVENMLALDAAEEGPGFTCFGNPSADTLMAWAPGQRGEFLRDGVARFIPAGAKIVFQMHYNTLGKDPAQIPGDQTRMNVWLTPGNAKPAQALVTFPFAHMNLDIPAGDPAVVERETLRGEWLLGDIPLEFPIRGIMAHMHQLGTAISLDVKQGSDPKACVIDIPRWDFDWQQTYWFPEDEPVMVGSASEFVMACHYDNSATNQQIVNGEQLEPRDVTWGDSTLDEMCLTYLLTEIPASLFE